jgi:integrase
MPKKPKYELIRCNHFAWRLSRRDGVWYADGRTNPVNVGRHSLGTRDKTEAMDLLARLDLSCAIKFGLIKPTVPAPTPNHKLSLSEGRRLYEEHISRARIIGGVKASTKKRYRTVFDKFIAFAGKTAIGNWDQVDVPILERYASHLEGLGYAQKTLLNELTTLKQAVKWLIEAKHLTGCEPIDLPLRKVESERAYCYRPAEVRAIVERCRQIPAVNWLGDVVVGLACTGMRIDELVNMKWADVAFENGGRITLTDESYRGNTLGPRRTLKSGRSRSFPIYAEFLAVLQHLPRIDQFVFHGPRGGRLKADTVRRVLVRDVLVPLVGKFPSSNGGKGFVDGRLHSFRHYFVSMCATNKNISERAVMEWVGHADSAMVRHYFHLHEEEARRQMQSLDLLGGAAGRSNGDSSEGSQTEEATPSR